MRYIDSVLESGSQLCLPTPVYYSDSDNLFRTGESGRTGKARIKQLEQSGGETSSPLVEEHSHGQHSHLGLGPTAATAKARTLLTLEAFLVMRLRREL